MNANYFFELLALEKLGWKDIHATNLDLANPKTRVYFEDYAWSHVLKKITPKILRSIFYGHKKFR